MRKAIEAIIQEGEYVGEKEVDERTHLIFTWRNMTITLIQDKDGKFAGMTAKQMTLARN